MTVYDTFTGKSIEIDEFSNLVPLGVEDTKSNRNTFWHFKKRTRYCFNRFTKPEYKHLLKRVYCLDTQETYECVNWPGFLMQINFPSSKSLLIELNKLSQTRKTIMIDSKLYCLYKNKDKISNHSLCSQPYQKHGFYDKARESQRIQRRLSNNLRSRVRSAVLKKSRNTFDLIGCPVEFLMGWLESKFHDGMTWDNYGSIDGDITKGWHVDHIIPCASFDLTDPDQQRKCFHYTNLQPLWGVDNMKKGHRT